MDVVLRHCNKTFTFSGIFLKDFTVPVVNNVESNLQIEPAIWFKSLIIESIEIDCDLPNVFWYRKLTDRKCLQMKRSIFNDSRLEEYELFHTAKKLMSGIEKKTKKSHVLASELLWILHLHVLPAIVLNKTDLPSLNNAKSDVENRIAELCQEIMQKDKDSGEMEQNLNDKMFSLLERDILKDRKYLKRCHEVFLTEILEDVNREIKVMTEKLLTFQSCVDLYGNPVTDDAKMNLLQWRKKRDQVQSSILKLQTARESVSKCMKSKRKRTIKSKPTMSNEEFDAYVELKEKLKYDKAIIRKNVEGKIKATAVREAINQACDDLIASGETTGCDVPKTGERLSTDILGSHVKPKKWMTLSDRIQHILLDKTCDISEEYQRFCVAIVKNIKDFLTERALFDRKKEANIPFFMQMSEFEVPPRKQKPQQLSNAYENIVPQADADSPELRFTQKLKEEITQHIYEQCRLLVQYLTKKYSHETKSRCCLVSVNKVWVIYELQLYSHLMQPLSELYEYVFNEKANEMFSFISNKTLHDLDIEQSWLKETRDEIQQNKCFESTVTKVSMRNGSTFSLSDLCESDDELSDMFDTIFDDNFSLGASFESVSEISENNNTNLNVFRPASKELENMIRSKSIMGKLNSIRRANRLTSECISSMKTRLLGIDDDNAINAEDMLSGTICVLTKLDNTKFNRLFAHAHLANDLIPPFMMGSIQDWSLTNIHCAFQCLSCQMSSICT